MNKMLLLMCLLLPVAAQAEVSIDINVPGVSLHLGDRDHRGYYWDGYDWRPPQWWHAHQGRGIGERNDRGYYWDGGRWQPPAQHGEGRRGDAHHADDDRSHHDGHPHADHEQSHESNDRHDGGHGAQDSGKPYPKRGDEHR
ncbi:DUF2502 domain-containing protein [Serratia sp. JUb9]|uniref:DUF2502 domain-containing protein n=1 Tax=unclassified Serratia (in: enterobacteria) TaxID=2647522 RepID=UPI00164D7344|nr:MULTISPECIES: DUF2502 domain-containing protein [unclassified Serratia (in: enterobacteria)]MCA4822157.1 DUF2502 domain-containing protein [Serratia rubidaea]QNK30710.1 DUF2502 domain-containing protein [Serratia sp. JUb9]CAE1145520.1 conserved exported protein of unknown function [Serratia sp. Tan611]